MTFLEFADLLKGPIGGMLASAFALGAMAGYTFCSRTQLRDALNRIARIEDDVRAMREEHTEEVKQLREDHAAERTALITEIHRWQEAYVRLTGQEMPG